MLALIDKKLIPDRIAVVIAAKDMALKMQCLKLSASQYIIVNSASSSSQGINFSLKTKWPETFVHLKITIISISIFTNINNIAFFRTRFLGYQNQAPAANQPDEMIDLTVIPSAEQDSQESYHQIPLQEHKQYPFTISFRF